MTADREPKLRVEALAASYDGVTILEDVTFEVEDQAFVSLLAPSGAGKSTLLKVLAGQLAADAGAVYVDGAPAAERPGHFAYMPQEDLLLPWASVYDNVTLHQRLHPREAPRDPETVYRLIRRFGLEGYEYALPETLSGGMRQRAAFLRTALCPADILLFDEPFGALDVITRSHLQDWLLHMRQELKRTILLVTHDLEEAIYLSDRILIMHGRPSSIRETLTIETPPEARDRRWLFEQGALKAKLYTILESAETAWDPARDRAGGR